jgi:hypothetical protein
MKNKLRATSILCRGLPPFDPHSGKRGEGKIARSGNQPGNLLFDQSQESGVASPRNQINYPSQRFGWFFILNRRLLLACRHCVIKAFGSNQIR